MYQASLSRRRSSSPSGSRVWSHNTGYTGAAGIHSEVGQGTQARNQLTHRNTSNALTAEEDIMKKEMKSLRANKKSMEHSMLMYSQKMRDISQQRNLHRKSPIAFHSTKYTESKNEINRGTIKPQALPTSLSILGKPIRVEQENNENYDTFPAEKEVDTARRKPESRMSVDSGISLDSHRDTVASESQCVNPHQPISARSTSSADSSNHAESNDGHRRHRGRGRTRLRFCDSKTSKLAPVVDEEANENEESNDAAEEEFETPRIAPFPDELLPSDGSFSPSVLQSFLECEEGLEDFCENRVLDPLWDRKNARGGYRLGKGKKRSPYVFFRPKPTQSPSLAALRHRFLRRFGPNSVYFRYSQEVLAALRSLSNSPQRQKSGKSSSLRSLSPPGKPSRSLSPSKASQFSGSPRSSPTLHGIDLQEILQAHSSRAGGLARLFLEEDEVDEFFVTKDYLNLPPITRVRTTSASSRGTQKTHERSYVSRLEDVKEHDDSTLKPVLKKDEGQYSQEKKNVQFFLPDIFMRANACTSQPTDYTARSPSLSFQTP